MSWEQLGAIRQQARQDAREHEEKLPEACPNDGTPLQIHPDGRRNCPAGDYMYPRDGKLLG